MKTKLLSLVFSLLVAFPLIAGDFNRGKWGDQGNGTYNNPLLPGDFSDPDIIRVGKDYYFITSTFQLSPGLTILHSKDLVNWSIIGSAVSDITQMRPKYNWDVMDGYGRCIWAPCITFNPKTKLFYIHWGTPEDGYFVVSARHPRGPWSSVTEVLKADGSSFGKGWDDCGVLWDNDGQGYFIGANFANNYKCTLFKLSADGTKMTDKGIVVHEGNDRYGKKFSPEANKIFKKDGYYYFYHNEVADRTRKAAIMRSKYIYGVREDGTPGTFDSPGIYEHGVNFVEGYREPNQGNLIDTPDGKNWYFFTQQGNTQMDGRPVNLIPVVWKNGWPVPTNDEDGDGVGRMEHSGMKMHLKSSPRKPQTSDEFSGKKLNVQWMWNYQPRTGFWSLTERKGFMRLKAFGVLSKDEDLSKAGNTLLQRSYRTENNTVVTKLDLSGIAPGQNCGLTHSAGVKYSAIGIMRTDSGIVIRYFENKKPVLTKRIAENLPVIYFKSTWTDESINQYFYSLNGVDYLPFGEKYQMVGSNYRGDYVGIFNFNNLRENGFVDVDYFRYDYSH